MPIVRRIIFGAATAALIVGLTGCTATKTHKTTPQTAIYLGESWGRTLSSRNPDVITSQYAPDAVLLATFTNEITSKAGVRKYFAKLSKKPGLAVKFNTMTARYLAKDVVSLSGLYTFSYREHGRTVRIPSRYDFVWEKRGGKWVVIEHHSSVQPEKR